MADLAVECAALGFDEILLTDFSFPTVGKLDKIQYPEAGKEPSLAGLLTTLREALDQAGYEDVALSVELPAEAVLTGRMRRRAGAVGDCSADDRIYSRTIATQAEALWEAVEAAGGTLFVPELQSQPQDWDAYLVEAN